MYWAQIPHFFNNFRELFFLLQAAFNFCLWVEAFSPRRLQKTKALTCLKVRLEGAETALFCCAICSRQDNQAASCWAGWLLLLDAQPYWTCTLFVHRWRPQHPGKAPLSIHSSCCIHPHKINISTPRPFLRSERVQRTSSVMVHCSVSMSFPQGAVPRLEREGESGEELKLISCPLKTHVSFNHQLLPVVPTGSAWLCTITTTPVRSSEMHNLFQLQWHSNNGWLYVSTVAFIPSRSLITLSCAWFSNATL